MGYENNLFRYNHLGVTLRKNFGSGFPFPLFLSIATGLNPWQLIKKSSTTIPHADTRNSIKPCTKIKRQNNSILQTKNI
jgi:hypothetical protein